MNFYDEFRQKHPKSNIKRGTLMALDRIAPYRKMAELDSHLLFMENIGVISSDEYEDLYKWLKEM